MPKDFAKFLMRFVDLGEAGVENVASLFDPLRLYTMIHAVATDCTSARYVSSNMRSPARNSGCGSHGWLCRHGNKTRRAEV